MRAVTGTTLGLIRAYLDDHQHETIVHVGVLSGRALLPLASSLQVVPPLKLVFSLHDGTTRSAAKLSMKHLKNLGEGSKFRSDCGAPFTLSTRTSSWQQDAGVFMVQGCTLTAASRTEALGSGD